MERCTELDSSPCCRTLKRSPWTTTRPYAGVLSQRTERLSSSDSSRYLSTKLYTSRFSALTDSPKRSSPIWTTVPASYSTTTGTRRPWQTTDTTARFPAGGSGSVSSAAAAMAASRPEEKPAGRPIPAKGISSSRKYVRVLRILQKHGPRQRRCRPVQWFPFSHRQPHTIPHNSNDRCSSPP